MTHIEIPLPDGTHFTVVHFQRHLSHEEGENVLRGMKKIGEMGTEIQFFWGAPDFVGPRKSIPARLVEDANGVYTEMRKQLLAGLEHFGIPVSNNYGPYLPHVTKGDMKPDTWTTMLVRPCWALVQKPSRVEVPFGA